MNKISEDDFAMICALAKEATLMRGLTSRIRTGDTADDWEEEWFLDGDGVLVVVRDGEDVIASRSDVIHAPPGIIEWLRALGIIHDTPKPRWTYFKEIVATGFSVVGAICTAAMALIGTGVTCAWVLRVIFLGTP